MKVSPIIGMALCAGVSGLLVAASNATAPSASAVLNNPSGATVSFRGTPQSVAPLPSDAITLQPGASVPTNAPVGQPFVVPAVLPSGWQDMLVLRVNPGQTVQVNGYNGPMVLESTDPTIETIEPNSSYAGTSSATAISDSAQGSSVTWAVAVTYENLNTKTGGTIDFDGHWVLDNHVLFDYSGTYENETISIPTQVIVTRSVSQYELKTENPTTEPEGNTGLASFLGTAPTGSEYNIDVVRSPAAAQQDTAYSYNNQYFQPDSVDLQLLATGTQPSGYSYFPDPVANIYDRFQGYLEPGWSGSGMFDSENHLIAIDSNGSSSQNREYGFDGADIISFLSTYGIPYSTSSGY